MREFGFPALYAALLWWFATGIILYLDGLPVRTFRYSMAAASLVLAVAVYQLHASSADVSAIGAYIAFTSAVLVWGWLEMSFLMGFITGPRKTGCAASCHGGRHFLHAVEAILYNEVTTLLTAAGILAATWTSANRLSLWTFLVLWVMRISAKLNLYFGVPNLGEKFLPPHLQYLQHFFRKRTMNFLFPLSITGSTVTITLLVHKFVHAVSAFQSAAFALLSTLLGLAVLEHWFMVLPLPTEKLWNWALRSQRPAPAALRDQDVNRQLAR